MTKKLTFDEAYEFIREAEGGCSNHKNDRGGKTNYGVTQYTYNLYKDSQKEPRKDVKNISEAEAKKVYKDIFWDKSGSSRIEDPDQALIYFDMAVNSGEGKARELYQKSNGNTDKFIELRRENYKEIIKRDPSQKVFEEG